MYVPILLAIFQSNVICSTYYDKVTNLMNIREVRAELFSADGHTYAYDIATSLFSNFCKRA